MRSTTLVTRRIPHALLPARIPVVLLLVTMAIAGTSGGDETDTPNWFRTRALWDQIGGSASSFEMAGGQLSLQRGEDEPSALLTKADFENFELSVDFLLSKWCESGLYVHAPRNGAWPAGLEIALSSQSGSPDPCYQMGAISGVAPPLNPIPQEPNRWYTLTMRMDWPRLHVAIDGTVVQALDLSADEILRNKLRRGAIGFQNNGYAASFRNFTLTSLPDSIRKVSLFDGVSLEGWSVVSGDATWTVEDGVLIAANSDGYLKHELLVQDFRLRAYIRTSPLANGGIFFRWSPEDNEARGYEIQILDVPGTDWNTGSIYSHARGNDLALTPGDWELVQIEAIGGDVRTFVNGNPSASARGLDTVRKGHIVLQMHRTRAQIEFRDIVIEPLDP